MEIFSCARVQSWTAFRTPLWYAADKHEFNLRSMPRSAQNPSDFNDTGTLARLNDLSNSTDGELGHQDRRAEWAGTHRGYAFREAADHKGLSLMLLSIDQIRVGKRLRQTRPSESLKLPKASADWAS